MANTKTIKEYLRALDHIKNYFQTLLDEENKITPPPDSETDRLIEITDLRSLVRSNAWPEAISPNLISDENNEEDKMIRADGIIQDFLQIDLNGKRFLDYGCGEGYVAYRAAEYGTSLSLGYDIEKNIQWTKFQKLANLDFTDELEENYSPKAFTIDDDRNITFPNEKFDVILLYDVIDHITDGPLEWILDDVKKYKKPDGTIHVRCHPWTSRHGTHLYRQLNKAYLDLVFTEQELYGLGLKPEKIQKIIDPIDTYKQCFAQAGLKIIKESTIKQEVDMFFTTRPVLIRRIKDKFKESPNLDFASGAKFPHEIMEIQFADFILQ